MRRREVILCLLGIGGVATGLALRARVPSADASPGGFTVPVDANAVPVLVELFTSEGCSSCPAADAVLARLERTQPVSGARVVPLGLHVDYWDRLGWTDPFSSARASARQRGYAPSLGTGAYTPQAVIDGRAEAVGSRGAAVEQKIAEAAKRPHAAIAIDVARNTGARSFDLEVRVGALPAGSANDAEALVAVVQTVTRVVVPRGENAGSTLEHTAIARGLSALGPAPIQGASLSTTIETPPGITPRDVRIVVFVQERASRRVLGTATRDLAPAPAR